MKTAVITTKKFSPVEVRLLMQSEKELLEIYQLLGRSNTKSIRELTYQLGDLLSD